MKQTQTAQTEKSVAEELWLMYFNNYLYERGLITEDERNRMVAKIAARKTKKTS